MLVDDDHAQPTACAYKRYLTFDHAIAATELGSRTALLLSEFTGRLAENADRLVGHIKGLIDTDDQGHLLFSITSFEEGPRFKGEMVGEVTEAVLTINVIVYGIEEQVVDKMLEEAFARHFHGNRSRDDGGEEHAQ